MGKRFTFADAKERIKELEAQVNVDLTDNIVTEKELRTLKVYKIGFFISVGIVILLVVSLFV